MTRATAPVIKVQDQNIDNHLSALQTDILDFLKSEGATGPRPGGYIAHLPTTGRIVDGVGRDRDKAGFASVSRALDRLRKRGFVVAFQSVMHIRGKGFRYALAGVGANVC